MPFDIEPSPKQLRYIRFLLRKHPDTVRPLLAGREIDSLDRKAASNLLDAILEKHPRNGGGQNEQEREQYRQRLRDEQNQRDQERRQRDEEQEQDEQEQQEQKDQQIPDNEDDMKNQNRKQGFRRGSKSEYIANALRQNDLDVDKTRKALEDRVGKIPALTFTQNVDGKRKELPLGTPTDDSQQVTQHGRLLKSIYAIRRNLMLEGGQKDEQKEERKEEQKFEHKQEHKQEEREERKDNDKHREGTSFLAWCRQWRAYCKARAAQGDGFDVVGVRPVEYGAAMIASGIPQKAIKHACTMSYPPEHRRALGVTDYDVSTYKVSERIDGIHMALPYLIDVVESLDESGFRIPAALIGDKGTGKTRLARDLAKVLTDRHGRKFDFGAVSMTSGTSPSAFNGRQRVSDDGTLALVTALAAMAEVTEDQDEAERLVRKAMGLAKKAYEKGDVVMSQFVKIYSGGGVFLFDEMDAADENLLIGVNMALANNEFANPITGEMVEQHPDFIAIAGMNTHGLGAQTDYTGRNRLDAATLDRFNPGRIVIELDEAVEEKILWTILNR